MHKICIFWSTLFKFAEIGDLETADTISLNSERQLTEIRCPKKVFRCPDVKFCAFFANLAQ